MWSIPPKTRCVTRSLRKVGRRSYHDRPKNAVASSSQNRLETDLDLFTDPLINRLPRPDAISPTSPATYPRPPRRTSGRARTVWTESNLVETLNAPFLDLIASSQIPFQSDSRNTSGSRLSDRVVACPEQEFTFDALGFVVLSQVLSLAELSACRHSSTSSDGLGNLCSEDGAVGRYVRELCGDGGFSPPSAM